MAIRNPFSKQPKQAISIGLQVGPYAFTFVRKNTRSVRLSINRLGVIRLSAPFTYTEQEALNFVEKRQTWLEKHLDRIHERQLQEAEDFSRILFLGNIHPTCIHQHPIAPRVAKDEVGTVHIYVKSDRETNLEPILNAWYAVELRKRVDMLAPKWESMMGVKAQSFSYRSMNSRWGSCHIVKRKITLNTKLAKHSLPCIEYILVHELAHLLESGHGPAFKAVMDTYLPDWRERRKKLNEIQ
jgi:predicted metal-dependent hydrolase